MGPTSKDALLARWRSDSEFQGAVLEELRGLRVAVNKLVGMHALEKETVDERIDRLEERVTGLEHPRPS